MAQATLYPLFHQEALMSSACSWTARVTRPLFLWFYAAVAIQLAADCLLKYGNPRPPVSFLAAFFPALLWIIVIAGFVRGVLRLDEFQRRLHLEAVSIGCALSAVLVLILSALGRAGIYHASLSVLGGCFLLLFDAAYGFLLWRYR
jgi:hypothetical protein